MGTLSGIISSLSSLAAKLLPETSSSSPSDESDTIEKELNKLMKTLKRIKATLHDAEERQIRDESVKLWLKELKEVAYDAEDVLDEYQYEVLRAEVESRGDSAESSRKRKTLELPDDLADRIKETMNKFNEIAKHRDALQLREEDGPRRRSDEMRATPTSSLVIESDIVGRENDKEELINLLCSNTNSGDSISVVTIVGMGGLGKTTIAQLVYNDPMIRQKFDLFGWVCVSDDFSMERLTKEVLESITRSRCDINNFNVLQEKLEEKMKGKNIFLVLDDVWNEKRSIWEMFRIPFLCAKSAKILVTTRNEPVARIMQTIPSFKLQDLSEEQCWQMFMGYASVGSNCNEAWKLEIGKQIMKKCGRLPLAVKSIASLLRHEENEESWQEILENELWKLESTKDIFPPLQISYSRLPIHLKPCLLYCSIFPKDYIYHIKELIRQWYAHGYLELKGRKTIDEIGEEYVKHLFERSFLDYANNHSFKLHDMVHDLVLSNSGNGCYSIEYGKPPIFLTKMYHLYLNRSVELANLFPSGCLGSLRTLLMEKLVENSSTFSNHSEMKSLRVAVCSSFTYHDYEFLNSIGNSKHLRYISLSRISFEKLPECMYLLYNLQILDLNDFTWLELSNSIGNLVSLQFFYLKYCHFLRIPESIGNLKNLKVLRIKRCRLDELPENIGNLASLEELELISENNIKKLPLSFCQLKSLRLLRLESCWNFKELPHEMVNLTNLQTLIVHGTRVSSLPPGFNIFTGIRTLDIWIQVNNLDEIGWLNDIVDLKGVLCFIGLGNLSKLSGAEHHYLVNKHNLEFLVLDWEPYHPSASYSCREPYKYPSALNLIIRNERVECEGEADFLLLESLQPHPNLKGLAIIGYVGTSFPKWVGDPLLCTSLENISLEKLNYLKVLPFSLLLNLKYLKILKCSFKILQLPSELQELIIEDCDKLVFVSFSLLHNLKYLKIVNCSFQFLQLPSQLEDLIIYRCNKLVCVSVTRNLNSLVTLGIYYCRNLRGLVVGPGEHSLESTTDIEDSLFHQSSMGLQNLPALKSLEFLYCPNLEMISDELIPVESCEVHVQKCPKLREWCLQHSFRYTEEKEEANSTSEEEEEEEEYLKFLRDKDYSQ